MNDNELLRDLKELLIKQVAAIVGCADLSPVPAEKRKSFPRGISIGVALSPEIIAGITTGPTDAYSREYDRANMLLDRLSDEGAKFLHGCIHHAVALSTTAAELDKANLTTPLPHKTTATLAGIGWIGKSALLVTEAYGTAVRYTTILTDAPLPVGEPITESRCGGCQACVEVCPAHAILGHNWRQGILRQEFYNAFACYQVAQQQGEKLSPAHKRIICGICIAACPYTKRYLAGKS